MLFNHVNKLVNVAARDDYIAHFFFWLHLFLHQKLTCQLLGHNPAIKGYVWVFLDRYSKRFSKLKKLLILGNLVEALLRVGHLEHLLPVCL